MDLYGAVMLFLLFLPVYGIGYVCGMLNMRKNYLRLLNAEKREKRYMMRHAKF